MATLCECGSVQLNSSSEIARIGSYTHRINVCTRSDVKPRTPLSPSDLMREATKRLNSDALFEARVTAAATTAAAHTGRSINDDCLVRSVAALALVYGELDPVTGKATKPPVQVDPQKLQPGQRVRMEVEGIVTVHGDRVVLRVEGGATWGPLTPSLAKFYLVED